MAKDAHDREDLLRDATGYVERMEFHVPHVEQVLFSGFRDEGAWSLYWGQDQVVQFNQSGALRRAFWQDRMLGSYRHRLHWLLRQGSARAKLSREPLREDEQTSFLRMWEHRLQDLHAVLAGGRHDIVGCVPDGADVAQATLDWLTAHPPPLQLAMHPGVHG